MRYIAHTGDTSYGLESETERISNLQKFTKQYRDEEGDTINAKELYNVARGTQPSSFDSAGNEWVAWQVPETDEEWKTQEDSQRARFK